MTMDIKTLTEKMNDFVTTMGWYKPNSPKPQTLKNLAISLSIEASEVLEHLQWSDKIENEKEFSKELADVALYLFQIASIANVNLEEAILSKLKENYMRDWNTR